MAKWNPAMPLFSSREISKFVTNRWFRNTQKFNKSYMKSDDQVFFHVFMAFAENLKTQTSEYGNRAISVRPSYLKDHAWVSIYIMHPEDLGSFARQTLGLKKYTLDEVKTQLHKYDFTWDDFVYYIRTDLLHALIKLKNRDIKKFRHAVQTISNNPSSYEATKVRLELIPTHFEMKVPVAIPGDQILIF